MNDLDIQLLKISSLFSDQLLLPRLVLLEVDPHLDSSLCLRLLGSLELSSIVLLAGYEPKERFMRLMEVYRRPLSEFAKLSRCDFHPSMRNDPPNETTP